MMGLISHSTCYPKVPCTRGARAEKTDRTSAYTIAGTHSASAQVCVDFSSRPTLPQAGSGEGTTLSSESDLQGRHERESITSGAMIKELVRVLNAQQQMPQASKPTQPPPVTSRTASEMLPSPSPVSSNVSSLSCPVLSDGEGHEGNGTKPHQRHSICRPSALQPSPPLRQVASQKNSVAVGGGTRNEHSADFARVLGGR